MTNFHFDAGPFVPSFTVDAADALRVLVEVQRWDSRTALAALSRLAHGVTDSVESRGLTITLEA